MDENVLNSRKNSCKLDGWDGGLLAVLAILTWVAFLPVRHAQFILYDDPDYVTSNPVVQKGITFDGVVWAFTTGHASNWHPITWLSHMLDCELFGLDPMGPHLINVGLHLANAALLFVLLRIMTGFRFPSALTAYLFAIHPAHVESVAWISERKDVLSTAFWMLTTWLFVLWLRDRKPQRYGAMMMVFGLGLMAKPMLVTLPFTLVLLDFWPLGRLSWDRSFLSKLGGSFREKIPLFALSILSIGVTVWVQGHGGAVRTIEELPLLARVENVVVSYARYLGILVWPKDLCAFYPFPGRWPIMWTVGSTILLIVITLLGVVMAKRKPFVLVGWLWFMGTLVPVIGLVQVGSQSIADRYTYIPSIGVFMALAWGVDEMAGRFRHGRRWQWAVGVAVSVALAAATYVQAGRWQNNAILYRHTLAVSRSFNVYAHYFVGIDCFERGDDAEARRHFELIVKAAPAFSKGHAALGTVLAHQRDYDRALTHLKRALVLEPDVADVHLNVAQILDDRGDAAGAKAHYLDVLRLDPESYVANYRLGRLYWRAGDHARAAIHFERALIENPHDHAAKRAFIEACLALGQRDRAVRECLDWMTWARGVDSWMRLAEQFERLNMLHEAATALAKAVAADPANPESYHRLGIFLAAYGQTNLAIGYLEVAVRLHGDNSSARMALATALLSLGRTQEAILQLRQASIRRPEDTTLALHATGLLLRHGKTQEAISFFQEAWKRNPRLSLAAIDWIEQLHDTDQRKQAILFFDSLRAFVLENNQHELASAMDALARLLTVKGTRP